MNSRKLSFLSVCLLLTLVAGGMFLVMNTGRGQDPPSFEENEDVTTASYNERDPTCVVDANGTIHAFFARDSPIGYQIMYANRTAEDWAVWGNVVNISQRSGDNVHPTVVIGESAPFVQVIHLVYENLDEGKLYYTNWTMAGGAWFVPTKEIYNITGVTAKPHLASFPNIPTNLSLVFRDGLGGIDIHQMEMRGGIWGTAVNISKSDFTSDNPTQAVNSTEGVHIVWQEYDLNDWDILYANSTSTGFSTPINFTKTTEDDLYPQIAINATDDRLVVGWEAHRLGGTEQWITYGNSTDGFNFDVANVSRGTDPFLLASQDGGIHLLWRALEGASDFEVFYSRNESTWFTNPVVISQNIDPDEAPHASVDPGYGILNVVWIRNDANDRVDFAREYTAPPNVSEMEASDTLVEYFWETVKINASIEFFQSIVAGRDWGAWVTINTSSPTTYNLTNLGGNEWAAFWPAYYAPDVDYEARFYAYDGFKLNTSEILKFSKDTTDDEAPLVTIHAPENNTIVDYYPITISASFQDHSGVVAPNVTINATDTTPEPLPENFTMPMSFNVLSGRWEAAWTNVTLYPNGNYSAYIGVRDTLGYVNTSVYANFTKDSDFDAPYQVIIHEPTMNQNITTSPFRLNVTCKDNRGVDEVKVRVNASTPIWITLTTSDGENFTGTWDDAQSYPEAWYNFTVYAYDAFDNVNSSEWVKAFRGFVQTDFQAPTIVGFNPKEGTIVPCCPVWFNVTISDASGITAAWIEINTATPTTLTLKHVQGTLYEVCWTNVTGCQPGDFTATVYASDKYANTASVVRHFRVIAENCTGPTSPGGSGTEDKGDDGTGNGDDDGRGEWYRPPGSDIPGFPVSFLVVFIVMGWGIVFWVMKRRGIFLR